MLDLTTSEKQTTDSDSGTGFKYDSGESRRQRLARRFEIEAVPHLSHLKRLAMHLTRSHSEAEDLVQETFTQALKSFDRYEAGTNCRAWLCKIMFYKRAQWIRANARFSQFDENENRLPARACGAMLPPDFIGENLSRALVALPDKFREIIWLAAVEEFTYREIAAELDIPVGTVMSRLHRGRKILRVNFIHYANKTSARSIYN